MAYGVSVSEFLRQELRGADLAYLLATGSPPSIGTVPARKAAKISGEQIKRAESWIRLYDYSLSKHGNGTNCPDICFSNPLVDHSLDGLAHEETRVTVLQILGGQGDTGWGSLFDRGAKISSQSRPR